MKKIFAFASALTLLCSCYESYVKDYDYSGVYIAYQYDLRSFVVGEGMTFDIGTVLGGVINNTRDRIVEYVVDDELVTGDLSAFGGTDAYEGMYNFPSQPYVTSAMTQSGVKSLSPLPREYYTLSTDGRMTIRAGSHEAVTRISVDSLALIADSRMGHEPFYAIGWRIISADADTVLAPKSFQVVALRLENMFFGDWYHGGECVTMDSGGREIPGSRKEYPTRMPSSASSSEVYVLTTSGAYSCSTNYFHNQAGSMTINMDGRNVSVSGEGITDTGSHWNNARLLQNRKIFLNYEYPGGDNTVIVVKDTLTFRSRQRDGVNEWQDTNREHYE